MMREFARLGRTRQARFSDIDNQSSPFGAFSVHQWVMSSNRQKVYGGTGGKPSDGGSFFDFMGFCGSVVFPGCPEWQVSTGVIVRNPSEKPPFCPGMADGFEPRQTGTGFPEIRWLALLVSFSSIRHTSARSGNRIKGGLP
jgi:hypothetical protein